jgi:fructose-specific component phosphotransferase system IIB-like protein
MLAVAVPATAQTFGFTLGPTPHACLSIGDASYRVTTGMLGADLTVRIDPAAAAPDIRVQLAETADEADFVFVDDGDAQPSCGGARAKTVKIDAAASSPDLVVAFAAVTAPADYRIYVRSRWLSPEAAAALFAASHAPARRLAGRVAIRSN